MAKQSPIFITEGHLHPKQNEELYQERDEDAGLWDAVRQGKYVALLGAHQTGKTSLLYMLRHKLLTHGTPVALVDLTTAVREAQGWYLYVFRRILDELGVVGGVRTKLLTDHQDSSHFDDFLRDLAQYVETGKIVILLDETDAILHDVSEPFIWAIRSGFSTRHTGSGQLFEKYVFVLSGSRALQELTAKGKGSVSPFNIGKRIYTSDLSKEATTSLVKNLEKAGFSIQQDVIAHLYGFTSGHPYLTSRVCALLEVQKGTIITKEKVETAVAELQEDDDCLASLIAQLDADAFLAEQAERILRGERVRFRRISSSIVALELIGAIKRGHDGYCQIRNKICETALLKHFSTPLPGQSPSPTSPPASGKRLGFIAALLVVTVIVGGASRDWLTTLASLVLFWSSAVIVFYLKDIQFADNTNDPDRQFTIQDIQVTSFYDPVIRSGQEHTIRAEVRYPSPTVAPPVILSLGLSKNMVGMGARTRTLKRGRENCNFKIELKRRATFLDLLLPFAQQQSVALRAEVNQETKDSIIKMNTDFYPKFLLSIFTSIASLISFVLKVAAFFKK